jgi:RimJ/RimL family protein N-acetyltransferase
LREEGKAALFAITSTDQGELLGAASVRDVDHRRRQALIGYWLALEARSRGAATDAVDALSVWAFDGLDLDEVYADVLRGNDASTRVLERCGYEARAEGSCTQRGLALPSTRYVRRAT